MSLLDPFAINTRLFALEQPTRLALLKDVSLKRRMEESILDTPTQPLVEEGCLQNADCKSQLILLGSRES